MTTYVFRNGKMVEKSEALRRDYVNIMSDIQPYKSMIDGHMVTSRSEHRDHLRAHNCIEIGNEKMESRPVSKTSRREFLHRQLGDMSDRQADKILKELRK